MYWFSLSMRHDISFCTHDAQAMGMGDGALTGHFAAYREHYPTRHTAHPLPCQWEAARPPPTAKIAQPPQPQWPPPPPPPQHRPTHWVQSITAWQHLAPHRHKHSRIRSYIMPIIPLLNTLRLKQRRPAWCRRRYRRRLPGHVGRRLSPMMARMLPPAAPPLSISIQLPRPDDHRQCPLITVTRSPRPKSRSPLSFYRIITKSYNDNPLSINAIRVWTALLVIQTAMARLRRRHWTAAVDPCARTRTFLARVSPRLPRPATPPRRWRRLSCSITFAR